LNGGNSTEISNDGALKASETQGKNQMTKKELKELDPQPMQSNSFDILDTLLNCKDQFILRKNVQMVSKFLI
jgi:hypothetical protein